MIRDILFRGKWVDDGEWVEGFPYITHGGEHQIRYYDSESNIENCSHTVIPDTLGRFSGLTDRNGVKIFEGDIIEFDHPYNGKSIHAVVQDGCGWNLSNFYASCFDYPGCAFSEGPKYMTVIGNVHDNPELLEVSGDEA